MSDDTHRAARRGVEKAAKHLLKKVVSKIGVYQSTGGPPKGHGGWRKIKPETRWRKSVRYGISGDKPLYASGDLKGSFDVVPGGAGRLSASVGSDSPYLIHHVYGAPRAHVPMRDPIRVTAVEERDACFEIIEKEILNELGV